ncbi:MAG TPA: hypothetical protein VK972_03075, partial [Wenzhouxiangella sp.]|nr:hypothetical protein [Wenzhouxiangella sp.]
LGWSIEFDDGASTLVIRNDPVIGTGYYVKFIDAAAYHADDSRRCAIEVYAAMSGIDEGVDPVFSVERYIVKSTSASSAGRKWHIIGDGRVMHILIDAADRSATHYNWHYLGDFKRYLPDDAANFFCAFPSDTSGGAQSPASLPGRLAISSTNASTEYWAMTDLPEALAAAYQGSPGAMARLRSYPPSTSSFVNVPMGSLGSGSLGGSLPAARVIVCQGNTPRGELIGVLNPLLAHPHGEDDIVEILDLDVGGHAVDAIYVPFTGEYAATSQTGSLYIPLSDWSDW